MIAHTTEFIPRLVYKTVFSEDGTLKGYVNSTMTGHQPCFLLTSESLLLSIQHFSMGPAELAGAKRLSNEQVVPIQEQLHLLLQGTSPSILI